MSVGKRIEKILRQQYDSVFRRRLMFEWNPVTVNKVEDSYIKFLNFVSRIVQFIALAWVSFWLMDKYGFERIVILMLVGLLIFLKKKFDEMENL